MSNPLSKGEPAPEETPAKVDAEGGDAPAEAPVDAPAEGGDAGYDRGAEAN